MSDSSDLTPADREAIVSIFEKALERLLSKDWEAWAELYSEDCVFHAPGSPPRQGHRELVDWGKGFPVVEMEWPDVEIRGFGAIAVATSNATFRLEGGPPVAAKQLAVFRRETDGWKTVALSFNSNDA